MVGPRADCGTGAAANTTAAVRIAVSVSMATVFLVVMSAPPTVTVIVVAEN
jgi:hypothetical protein